MRRDDGEGYREMLERLARESGVETPTAEDLARLERKRKGKKLSNTDWVSKSGPEAKIAKMKDGTTHLAYKPEHDPRSKDPKSSKDPKDPKTLHPWSGALRMTPIRLFPILRTAQASRPEQSAEPPLRLAGIGGPSLIDDSPGRDVHF